MSEKKAFSKNKILKIYAFITSFIFIIMQKKNEIGEKINQFNGVSNMAFLIIYFFIDY